ncbi:DUF4167 domain-containing protein [Devosia rhodophyticola]|uniref:DUF4167 domain-containing protein n=1 Tax=Devosia rhodophyticola TaxID=3026423 RepID=A0ABY7YTN7_9HYPH|nr:DUF4167 domain-containing protein [Devosia rhodophyticola]WDR04715.1 DUF4167 domain-containing protein [Devosia rhodophyticola]
MRPNQQNNKNNNRSRGRNGGRKHVNPLSRNFESNGPDVKVRGNAAHIAEKYMQLARDAQSSGDSVMAENYLQHAEHYFRIVSAAQPQNNANGRESDDLDDDMPEPTNRFSSPQPQPAPQSQFDGDGEGNGGQSAGGNGQRDGRDNRESRQPRTRPPAEAAPTEAPKRDDAVATGETSATEVEAAAVVASEEEPRKVRERRPRRRRPTAADGVAAEPGEAPQPEVGELPAFITAGGSSNAAE